VAAVRCRIELQVTSFAADVLQATLHMPVQSFPAETIDARSCFFSEQKSFCHLPLHEFSAIVDIAVTKGKFLHNIVMTTVM